MKRITIDEVGNGLRELIANLRPGQDIEITDGGRAVARLVAEPIERRRPRQPGSAVGQLIIVADDDEHLRDFQEYMP